MVSNSPDFLIIGAMRAGTTTLYHDLRQHPDVFMPEDKEPEVLINFRGRTERARREYKRLLRSARDQQLCGEASTAYAKRPDHEGIAEFAQALFGSGIKIVYMVRDPIERIISHHHHLYSRRQTTQTLDEAVRQDHRLLAYSRYGMQIAPWFDVFGDGKVKVICFENYVKDRRSALKGLYHFLGVDIARMPAETPYIVRNRTASRPTTTPLWRKLVHDRAWYKKIVKPRVPWRIRSVLAESLLVRADSRNFVLDEKTKGWLLDSLRDDVESLTKLCPSLTVPWLERFDPVPPTHERPAA
jgi:hypothetical protein